MNGHPRGSGLLCKRIGPGWRRPAAHGELSAACVQDVCLPAANVLAYFVTTSLHICSLEAWQKQQGLNKSDRTAGAPPSGLLHISLASVDLHHDGPDCVGHPAAAGGHRGRRASGAAPEASPASAAAYTCCTDQYTTKEALRPAPGCSLLPCRSTHAAATAAWLLPSHSFCRTPTAWQVVTYKWLGRRFGVPYDTAKRILFEFLTRHPQVGVLLCCGWVAVVGHSSQADTPYMRCWIALLHSSFMHPQAPLPLSCCRK